MAKQKILMLHGHGQSGDFFRYKTTHLRRILEKGFHPQYTREDISIAGDFELVYINAPNSPNGGENYVWGLGDFENDLIRGFTHSIRMIISYMNENGPFAGIIGFSSGGTTAAVIASLLEIPDRCAHLKIETKHPKLRFVISYSGFVLGNPAYTSLYTPKIQTPIQIFVGHLDSMISPYASLEFAQHCRNISLHHFYGSHHVPRDPNMTRLAVRFISDALDLAVSDYGEDEDQDDETQWEDIQ